MRTANLTLDVYNGHAGEGNSEGDDVVTPTKTVVVVAVAVADAVLVALAVLTGSTGEPRHSTTPAPLADHSNELADARDKRTDEVVVYPAGQDHSRVVASGVRAGFTRPSTSL